MWVRVGFPLIAVLTITAGCPDNTGPTYHTDIAPLLQRECMSCHQEGGIGPFELTTYDQAKPSTPAAAARHLVGRRHSR